MKNITILVSACLIGMAMAFQTLPKPHQVTTQLGMAAPTKKKSSSSDNFVASFLRGITNNFQPFHGHGSLENDLDEQWQAQQEILKNRRSHQLDKEHLKQKYKDPNSVTFDVGTVGTKATYDNRSQSEKKPKKSLWDNFTP